MVVELEALKAAELEALPFTSNEVSVPTLVKLEPVTVDFKVVPVKVPASAVTVISPVPSNATPLMFLGVINFAEAEAVPAIVAVAALPVVF
jgi:hypothetical protein